jgi:hypothetical protein
MDIADAFFNQHSLTWLSHLGIRQPELFSNTGIAWLKTFAGGLLVTCGLTHIGGPEKDEYGMVKSVISLQRLNPSFNLIL